MTAPSPHEPPSATHRTDSHETTRPASPHVVPAAASVPASPSAAPPPANSSPFPASAPPPRSPEPVTDPDITIIADPPPPPSETAEPVIDVRTPQPQPGTPPQQETPPPTPEYPASKPPEIARDSRLRSAEITTRSPGSSRPLPRVISISNQKGGVGKTTTTVNLGAGLAEQGYRVLVVDLDPQGNATTGLGLTPRSLDVSMYDVLLHDVALASAVAPTDTPNLFVAPANLDLAGAEIELVPAFSRELRLRNAIDEVREQYDYILIDCPPSLGLLTVNALAGADEVLVPIQCEYYALEGLGQLLRNVELVQKNLNRGLEVSTIVLVMYDARTKLSDQVAEDVRNHFGERVCRIMIPRNVRLSEAPSYGQPALSFDAMSRGAIAYRELAKEVSGGPPDGTR